MSHFSLAVISKNKNNDNIKQKEANMSYDFDKLIKDINKKKELKVDDKERDILKNFTKHFTYPRCDEPLYNIHMRYYKEGENINNIIKAMESEELTDEDVKKYLDDVNKILYEHFKRLKEYIKENDENEYIRFQSLLIPKEFREKLNDKNIFTKRHLMEYINKHFEKNVKTTIKESICNMGPITFDYFESEFKNEFEESIDSVYERMFGRNEQKYTINDIPTEKLIDILVNRLGIRKEVILKEIDEVNKGKIEQNLNKISDNIELSKWKFKENINDKKSFVAKRGDEFNIHLEYHDSWQIFFEYKKDTSQKFTQDELLTYYNLIDYMKNEEV